MNDPHSVESDTFDRNIVPAETAARKEREEENFKQLPDENKDQPDTTKGYTVNSEGIVNNFAVEPQMYVEGSDEAN